MRLKLPCSWEPQLALLALFCRCYYLFILMDAGLWIYESGHVHDERFVFKKHSERDRAWARTWARDIRPQQILMCEEKLRRQRNNDYERANQLPYFLMFLAISVDY